MKISDLRFACLLGHGKPKKLLREAAANNKLGHAYLFRGPDGVGKKRTALTLAAFLNCVSPGNSDSCAPGAAGHPAGATAGRPPNDKHRLGGAP